jgi:Predicted membrane protein
MDRMLVVVFDNETKAYEGKKALQQLDAEGSIGVYGYAVVGKNPDGSSSLKQGDDAGPLGTLVGTSLGSLIGALFGPVGMAIGATAGMSGGATADLLNAGVSEDFVDDVTKDLTPGKVALVSEIEEDWTTPVDTRMEAIGGIVFRRALSEVNQQVHDENVAAMKADMAQFKAEHAQANADRKAKLHDKINKLDAKIQAQMEAARQRRQAAERGAQAKAQILKAKASKAAAAAA